MQNSDELNRTFHKSLIEKYGFLLDFRPMQIASFLLPILVADGRRRVVSSGIGLRLYIDPFTHLGKSIISENTYEQETVDIFRSEIAAGQVVLDIGANEGVFSALASKLVGKEGMVIAIEPQSRLHDIIEINLRANDAGQFKIYQKAFGGDEQQTMRINLYPILNSGASSIVRQYRFSKKTEEVSFVSMPTIFSDLNLNKIDFVKVDVEGFEHLVIKELLPYLQCGQIEKLLLDYHKSILLSNKINPLDIHNAIIGSNMRVKSGDVNTLSSYVLYIKND